MGELGVLFNPGMRHEQEEKLAKQMLREDEGTGRKGRLGIDLESGVVIIGSPSADPAAEPDVDGTDSAPAKRAPAARTPDQADIADRHGRAEKPSRAEKKAANGKAKRRVTAAVAPDAPVGKSRRAR